MSTTPATVPTATTVGQEGDGWPTQDAGPPAQSSSSSPPSAPPSIIVTGFGPFGGVIDNPTTIIAQKLRSHLGGAPPPSSSGDLSTANHDLLGLIEDVIILETSARDVCETLGRLKAKFQQEEETEVEAEGGGAMNRNRTMAGPALTAATNNNNSKTKTQTKRILLHLGVDASSRAFKLERCAYNEATFRIPDQQQFLPHEEAIVPHDAFAKCYTTSIDLEALARAMRGGFPEVTTEISTDPGRFVCNYVYCSSLAAFGSGGGGATEPPPSVCSLFLHVPPFAVVPEEGQLQYVAGLLRAMAFPDRGTACE